MTDTRLLRAALILLAAGLCLLGTPLEALAHGVTAGDKGYIQEVTGVLLIPFAYLGAKHMVTGYDHLLFLLGIIFFLYRLKPHSTGCTDGSGGTAAARRSPSRCEPKAHIWVCGDLEP